MSTPTKKTETAKHVAEICLYGNTSTGAGWLAVTREAPAKPFGDMHPKADRTFTEAVWAAVEACRERGAVGLVRIFAPGGEQIADVWSSRVPTYGALPFRSIG